MPNVLLHAPRDFSNICVLARTLDNFGYRECYVFDPHHVIRERYGKSYSRRLRVVSSGAFEHIRWHRIEDSIDFIHQYTGRTIATVADPGAPSLIDLQFQETDLMVFGSESEGLPEPLVKSVACTATIPASGCTQSLNLAVAASIFLFEARRQLGEGSVGLKGA